NRANLVLEASDRTLAGNRIQAWPSSLVAKLLTTPDLVAQELEALRDVHDTCLVRMQPKPKPSLQHRTSARQRPLRFRTRPADGHPIVRVPRQGKPRPLHLH